MRARACGGVNFMCVDEHESLSAYLCGPLYISGNVRVYVYIYASTLFLPLLVAVGRGP